MNVEVMMFASRPLGDDSEQFLEGERLQGFLNYCEDGRMDIVEWWNTSNVGDVMETTTYFGETSYLIKVNKSDV